MKTITLVFLSLITFSAGAQEDCESSVTIVLKNMNGGFFKGQTVTMTAKSGGSSFELLSDANGEVTFKLPCNTIYNLTVSNYAKTKEVQMPEQAGAGYVRTFTYEPDMIAKQKAFAMTPAEQGMIDKMAVDLPDTFFMKGPVMPPQKMSKYFSSVTINLLMINNAPLANEMLCMTGVKRGKSVKGTTGNDGKIHMFLLKGDTYTLNFKYNKAFASTEIDYSTGNSTVDLTFGYLGTREIEKRKKEEAARLAAEEKKLKAEEERFKAYCKKLGITPEEGRKREARSYIESLGRFTDTVISAVLNRNRWNNKLIVCDLTGSMGPYTAQLSAWYQLHQTKEKDLQFVFFNDGDQKPDDKKKIGETGGIYYSRAKGFDSLANFVAKVSSAGSGGDCPENNMEALIKGTKMCGPFKELVMIVDNNAPVKDIELLKKFNVPVHVILCGVADWVLLDYLMIAWKTKGSIHTIEQDITKIASMMEGQDIKIGGITYRIMGGEFVRITKT